MHASLAAHALADYGVPPNPPYVFPWRIYIVGAASAHWLLSMRLIDSGGDGWPR